MTATATKISAGQYEITEHDLTVRIVRVPELKGWVAAAEWDRHMMSDPLPTLARAKVQAADMLTSGHRELEAASHAHEATAQAAIIPCDDRCMFAEGDDCDCFCGGINHKQGFRLTAAQRAIVRTAAGRRVTPLTPNTAEFRMSARWHAAHEAGQTKREIAATEGVSAPTVRRMITRYLLTVALLEQQG